MNIHDLLKDAAIKHGYTRGQCGIDNMRIAKAAKVSSDDVKTLLGTLKRKMPPLMVLAKVAALLHVDSEIMDYLVAGSLQNVTPDNHQPDSCGSGDSETTEEENGIRYAQIHMQHSATPTTPARGVYGNESGTDCTTDQRQK
ncbi:TPA: hypothetical protein ACURHJ_004536 [Escherichia coli]